MAVRRALRWVCFGLVVGVAIPHMAAAADLAAVRIRVNKIEKTVSNELSNEEDCRAAEKDLLKALDELRTGREPPAGSPEAKTLEKIGRLLMIVRARLTEPYAGGSGQRSALPVPNYRREKVIGQAARRLAQVQSRFLEELRKSPQSEAVQKQLIQVVLSQENLAWEVAWPFTSAEAGAIKAAAGLTEKVYLSRRKRGVELINQHLKADFENVGRSPPREFSIFRPASKEDQQAIAEALTKLRGKAAASWAKDTTLFDDKVEKALRGGR